MKILWLASWYPNKLSPLDGDFIQRHARAVSIYTPLTVIYVTQYGEQLEVSDDHVEVTHSPNLTEMVVQFRFKKSGISILDKVRYNLKYYSTYKKLIKKHFAENGVPDLIHVHVPMKAGVVAKWIKRKWKVPNIVSEHSATYVKGPPDTFENRSLYFQNAVKNIFQSALLTTTVSEHDGKILKKKFNLKSVEIIRNVVDTNCFFLEPAHHKTCFRFIHVSAMGYQKNTDGILRACAALKKRRSDWKLELVGPINEKMRQTIDELKLHETVTIAGQLSNEMVAKQMQNASALVMFSRYENFPCTIIEAQCCGLPVIATNVGGIPETINGSNGYLVDSEDEQGLQAAMFDMIENCNRFDAFIIASKARDDYSYEKIGNQFLKLYDRVLNNNYLFLQ